MIVILCPSYRMACDAFDIFVQFLEGYEPQAIQKKFESGNCIETDDDLRYMFVDARLEHVFDGLRPDVMTVGEFFEGINDYYFCEPISEYYGL